MSLIPKPIEVEVGTTLQAGVQFISQYQVKDVGAAFSVDLPGTVYCCGEAVVQTILPRTRIVVPGEQPARAARISAAVTDHLARDRERAALLALIDSTAPLSFMLRFTVPCSFGEILAAADDAVAEECDCSCNGGEAALAGAIAIGLAPGAGGNLKWSAPFAAIIYARRDGALDFGGSEKAQCIAVRDNCSEDWELFNGTTCTGLQCTYPEECRCGDNKDDSAKTKCEDWVRCNCNV
jgi:hypothetical protein